MTVRTKVLYVSVLAVVVALVSGLLSFVGVQQLGSGVAEVTHSGSSLRVHMEIDRLCESLAVDVLNAVRIGRMVREARDKVLPVVEEHLAALNTALEKNNNANLPEAIRASTDGTYPRVKAYGDEALRLAELAFYDNFKAAESLDAFANEAAEIRAAMNEISNGFEAHNRSVEEGAGSLMTKLGYLVIAAALVTLAVLIAAGVLIARLLLRPLQQMTQVVTRLSHGDKAVEVPSRNRTDEIGEIAAAVQVFKENAIKTEALAAERQASVAKRAERAQVIDALCAEFDAAIGDILRGVGSLMIDLQEMARSMASNAEQTEAEASQVGHASNEANMNVNSVASAAEELAASVSEVSQQTANSSEIAGRAANQAQSTNRQVQGLSKAAQKVGEVVSMITDIANQTNLLALNATIEAARAGNAGKGFAVVASEVKNLASQTARATGEISQQIDTIQLETKQAVDAIESISKTIVEINTISSSVASAVEEQSATTREIARSAEKAARGTAAVALSMNSVSGQATQTGHAAARMLEAVADLANRSHMVQQKVDGFMQNIKSA